MNYIYGRGPVIEALNNGSVKEIYYYGMLDKKVKQLAEKNKIEIIYKKKSELDELVEGNHQSIVALAAEFEYASEEELFKEDRILILDHLTDPHNFGAIARSALCFGFFGIVIPKDRQIGVNQTVQKTSAGAVNSLKIHRTVNLSQFTKKLKENGYWIYAADLGGEDIRKVDVGNRFALVIGNEGKGVSKNMLKHSDATISIVNFSKFDSLNASVAAAVLMYETASRDVY